MLGNDLAILDVRNKVEPWQPSTQRGRLSSYLDR